MKLKEKAARLIELSCSPDRMMSYDEYLELGKLQVIHSAQIARAFIIAVEALESYSKLPLGRYSGPDDIYENLSETAEEALAEIEALK